MPSVSSVRSKANTISIANDDINDGKKKLQNTVFNTTSWWTGAPGEEVRSLFSDIQTDVDSMIKKIDSLKNSTGSLADDIQKADDERRRKREQSLKPALSVNKNTVKYK
jgi:uncharacterized protein YukE